LWGNLQSDRSGISSDASLRGCYRGTPRSQGAWALRKLAEAQTRAALQNPATAWEAFASDRLEWDAQAAVPVDLLLLAYMRWCGAHGEPVLAEANVLVWLTAHGATGRTGPLSHVTDVLGVRVMD